MILNGNDIKKLINEENLIENYNSLTIGSSSIDLSISNKILVMKKTFKQIDLSDPNLSDKVYEELDITNSYSLKPKECIFVILNEKINMPKNMVGHIRPRTSISRLGLYINFQHINSGYSGTLNLELYNMSPNTFKITPGLRIAQLVIEEITDGITDDLLYPNEKISMYQNEDGTTGSKIYADYIGKVFRHFKGNYYFIENISTDSETKEDVIVYRPLYPRNDSMLWTRPAKMFFEEIDRTRKDNITGQKYRFELAKDLTIDYTKQIKKDDIKEAENSNKINNKKNNNNKHTKYEIKIN